MSEEITQGKMSYFGSGNLEKATSWVNEALEVNRKKLESETLCGDLTRYLVDMNVRIIESDHNYALILDPLSGEGHDFDIRFDKKTQLITSLMVGSIDPDPEEEMN